jgi:hypothetical protein
VFRKLLGIRGPYFLLGVLAKQGRPDSLLPSLGRSSILISCRSKVVMILLRPLNLVGRITDLTGGYYLFLSPQTESRSIYSLSLHLVRRLDEYTLLAHLAQGTHRDKGRDSRRATMWGSVARSKLICWPGKCWEAMRKGPGICQSSTPASTLP